MGHVTGHDTAEQGTDFDICHIVALASSVPPILPPNHHPSTSRLPRSSPTPATTPNLLSATNHAPHPGAAPPSPHERQGQSASAPTPAPNHLPTLPPGPRCSPSSEPAMGSVHLVALTSSLPSNLPTTPYPLTIFQLPPLTQVQLLLHTSHGVSLPRRPCLLPTTSPPNYFLPPNHFPTTSYHHNHFLTPKLPPTITPSPRCSSSSTPAIVSVCLVALASW